MEPGLQEPISSKLVPQQCVDSAWPTDNRAWVGAYCDKDAKKSHQQGLYPPASDKTLASQLQGLCLMWQQNIVSL